MGLTPGPAPAMDRPAMGLLDHIQIKKVGTEPPQSIEINDRNEFHVDCGYQIMGM